MKKFQWERFGYVLEICLFLFIVIEASIGMFRISYLKEIINILFIPLLIVIAGVCLYNSKIKINAIKKIFFFSLALFLFTFGYFGTMFLGNIEYISAIFYFSGIVLCGFFVYKDYKKVFLFIILGLIIIHLFLLFYDFPNCQNNLVKIGLIHSCDCKGIKKSFGFGEIQCIGKREACYLHKNILVLEEEYNVTEDFPEDKNKINISCDRIDEFYS